MNSEGLMCSKLVFFPFRSSRLCGTEAHWEVSTLRDAQLQLQEHHRAMVTI